MDIKALKAAAAGRWVDILVQLGGCDPAVLDGRHHPCPRCGGDDRFSVIDIDRGAIFCRQCFNQKNGDGISALAWLGSWSFADTCIRVAEFLGIDWTLGKRGRKKKNGAPSGVYLSEDAAVRIAVAELTAAAGGGRSAKFARIDRYATFAVVRIDLATPAGEKQKKTFRPIHPIKMADGRIVYKWGYPTGPRPLFRFTELQAASDASLAVVVAGEKAAEAAAELGLVATTNAGGEAAVKQTDWGPLTRFGQVVICLDNDPTGIEYGARVIQALHALKPSLLVRVLLLPDLPPKGDIVEWIAAGGTLEGFLGLLPAEAVVPDPIAHDRACCAVLQLDVLGELPGGKIKVFSEYHGKGGIIEKIGTLRYADLLMVAGPVVRERVHRGGEGVPGMYSLDRVKDAIACVAGHSRAGLGVERGLGVWAGHPEAPGAPTPLVLVNPGHAAVWDGQKLEVVRRPRAGGLIVDLDHPPEEKWFCAHRLADYLAASVDFDWRAKVIEEIGEVFDLWYFHGTKVPVSNLLIGLVLATWIQTVWEWRPIVAISGTSSSGKSLLFETIAGLFGPLALLSSHSTEPGIRQSVGNHGRIILCDEFERSKDRQKILEFFRTSSRGSKRILGSSRQVASSQGLCHIPWVTAIEVGLNRAPDRNRFIMLELDAPPKEKWGKISLPRPAELADLGQRLLAISLRFARQAPSMAVQLRTTVVEHAIGRIVESWSVPAAALAVCVPMDLSKAQVMMSAYMLAVDIDDSQGTKDETQLMADILSSTVRLSRGEEATVGQILTKPSSYTGAWEALDRCGIAPVASTSGMDAASSEFCRRGLFIAHRIVGRALLKGTDWEGQSLDQHLSRFPGARKCQQRVGGQRPHGIEVPWKLLKEKFFGDVEADF